MVIVGPQPGSVGVATGAFEQVVVGRRLGIVAVVAVGKPKVVEYGILPGVRGVAVRALPAVMVAGCRVAVAAFTQVGVIDAGRVPTVDVVTGAALPGIVPSGFLVAGAAVMVARMVERDLRPG